MSAGDGRRLPAPDSRAAGRASCSTRSLPLTAVLWLVPIAGAIFASFRPFAETVRDGFFSWPHTLTLDNYRNAWEQGDIPRKYWNTALILVPSLVLTLFFSSMVAFVCSRFSWRFNILLLVDLHGRQPAAAADHHPAAVPVLQPRRAAGVGSRTRASSTAAPGV